MKTILCIDDEQAGLCIRKIMLEDEGYRVFTASHGEEGLAILESEKIDAVLLDYRMPSIDGAEVAHRIRARWPLLPIVMLSGYPDHVPEAVVHLVDAFVTKGGTPEHLLGVLEANLHGTPGRRITILNVDDNDEQRYAITRVLKHAGFNVIEASTGGEALKLAASRPQLMVLDVNLPDMLGFDVCRHLKNNAETRGIPVIHVSATYPSIEASKESARSGASRFLEHPRNLMELVAVVQQELHIAAGPPQSS